ncbi:nuclear transport factor 2 family protein [Desertimonas flava]|jgi:hypothetical protein|uniref:nuclear transport factor 2 family protein n=1 Tax=Desertimonas flava TaxID=2064846 RepID=UPI000E3492AF|nr:nuclear transport factor 2 family protein [Desertimonas flava]
MSDRSSFPPKFWASEQGLIDLQPLGAVAPSADRVLDRLLIQETFARFGIAHDENRVDVILSLLTEDVSFEFSTGSAAPQLVITGRDAVRDQLVPRVPLLYGQRRHCITNVVIDRLDETEATAIAYGVVPRAADGFVMQATVIYRGDLRKEGDGFWRFRRFFIGVDDYAGEGPGTEGDPPIRDRPVVGTGTTAP